MQKNNIYIYTLRISGVAIPIGARFCRFWYFCVDGILKHNKVLLKINEYMVHVHPYSGTVRPHAVLPLISTCENDEKVGLVLAELKASRAAEKPRERRENSGWLRAQINIIINGIARLEVLSEPFFKDFRSGRGKRGEVNTSMQNNGAHAKNKKKKKKIIANYFKQHTDQSLIT